MSDRDPQESETMKSLLQEELQEEFLKPLDQLEVGQIVEGTVVQVGEEQVFVDIGYKSEGKVPTEEFDERPEIGDKVHVVLLSKDASRGGVAVSKRKADEKLFWSQLKEAFHNRQPVEGRVTRSVKGGFEVRLHQGTRGFNPISKMDLRRIEDPEEYVGITSNFHIERLYSDNRVNIVLSRRAWLEEEIEHRRNEFFENTQVGDIVTGTVKSFTSFGAFIDLGGFDGLLHINDMSWGHVTRPKDYVHKGEEINVKVIRMDPEEKKINLSLRHMTEDPWNYFEEKYHVGDVVTGTVTKLTDFGAFIELEEGIEGLAHISELSWTKHVDHPKEILSPGEQVQAKILDYDVPDGKVSLGVKQTLPNPWDEVPERYSEGMRLRRPVKKITHSGAFIELEEGIDGFLHVDNLSWTKKYRNPSAVLTEGEEIDVMVLSVDQENHNIRLGVKQLEEDPWQELKRAYSRKRIVEGEITNITDFGVFVRVHGGIEGLINKANLVDTKHESFEDAVSRYKVGQKIQAVITEVNPARNRLSLSVREVQRQEQRAELEKYIHDDEEETTLTLGEMLKEKEQT
ncbi:MAG: 30S ribosomal protein S1 [Spirochaetaceae bacterium]